MGATTRELHASSDTRHVFRWHRCGRGGGQLNWRTNALHIERVFDARPSHHFLYDFFTSLYIHCLYAIGPAAIARCRAALSSAENAVPPPPAPATIKLPAL